MKSLLGLIFACCAIAGFALAYWLSVRPGAGWLEAQWMFLAALPYNWTLLHVWGSVDFASDAPLEVAAAFLFDLALAYFAGAVIEAICRGLWRVIVRTRA